MNNDKTEYIKDSFKAKETFLGMLFSFIISYIYWSLQPEDTISIKWFLGAGLIVIVELWVIISFVMNYPKTKEVTCYKMYDDIILHTFRMKIQGVRHYRYNK